MINHIMLALDKGLLLIVTPCWWVFIQFEKENNKKKFSLNNMKWMIKTHEFDISKDMISTNLVMVSVKEKL